MPRSRQKCAHKKDVEFFDRPPTQWNLPDYLNFRNHKAGRSPADICSRWVSALSQISKCTSCPKTDRGRANTLLARYKKKTSGSDYVYMKTWLKEQTSSSTGQAATATATTVYGGQVFQNSTIQNSTFQANVSRSIGPDHGEVGDDSQAGDDRSQVELSQDSESKLDDTPTAGMEDTYAGFEDARKWHLKSGRAVEDVLFENYLSLSQDKSTISLLLRGWIIDLDSPIMKSWFTASEWAEIAATVPPLPSPSEHFGRSLIRFNSVKTIEDLRNVLDTTSYRPLGTSYDRELHFDSAWADNVIRSLLLLFDAPGQPLCLSHLENWYASRIWSPIIDQCFLSLLDMTFESADSVCRATSLRKNRARTDRTDRAKTGSRLDGILRTVEDDFHEFFCMEISSTFQGGDTSTKWLGDSQKLFRSLRDMLGRLAQRGGKQVVGAVAAGLKLAIWRMCHSKGYTCVLKRERIQTVPSKVENLKELLLLLSYVARMKVVLKECVEAVRGQSSAASDEELYEEVMGRRSTPLTGETVLPWPADTP